jgi:ActR/RegA family two-component response regulator
MAATVNNVLHLHDAPLTITGGTNLGELLRWAHGFLLPVARRARIQLEVIHQLDGVVVAADRHCLEQVLLNLALNAVRFMPGGGWLSLRGRVRNAQGGGFVELSVIDTGPGIEPENLDRIFEAGFSTRPGSPGLGLAVARKIVEGHGGTRRREPVGHGAFSHPHSAAGRSGAAASWSWMMSQDARSAGRSFPSARVAVDTATGVRQALSKFAGVHHPLVITDIRMGDGDGFEVMRRVRAVAPRTAVILFTAFASVPQAVAAMKDGACDYLVKPVSFEQLDLAAARVLKAASLQPPDGPKLIGNSATWQRAMERARQAAACDADILIEAESGTEKSWLRG